MLNVFDVAPSSVANRAAFEKAVHEAVDRGLWAEPDPALLGALQQVYLETEGDLEDRA